MAKTGEKYSFTDVKSPLYSAYQNACRPNFKTNATVPKEIYLNPAYFKNLCLIL